MLNKKKKYLQNLFYDRAILQNKEGIFAGMSSGAAMLAAVRTAEKIESGNIVVLFPDRAEKYLSTVMFDPFNE